MTPRAERLLSVMRQSDGRWVKLSLVPGVGRKTIAELIDANAIEIRAGGRSVWSYDAMFRVTARGAPDFGDLWLE